MLLAKAQYDKGHGDKGSLAWDPVPAVSAALDKAFYAAFGAVEPTGKRFVLALDTSGTPFSWVECRGQQELWLPRGRWTLDVGSARGAIGTRTITVDGVRPVEVDLP